VRNIQRPGVSTYRVSWVDVVLLTLCMCVCVCARECVLHVSRLILECSSQKMKPKDSSKRNVANTKNK